MISDEAVEAAARRLAAENGWEGPYPEGLVRAALEEAAPILMSEAWEEGMAAAKLQAAGIKPARNPYRSPAMTTPDEARVFIRYEDRYEFIDAEGRIVAVMTPREFDMWKTRNPYRSQA